MKKFYHFILVALISFNATAQAPSAKEIIQKSEERMRGNNMTGEMLIKTVRPNWTREMEVKTWSKGTDYSLILILSPARDKGTTFLKRKKEVWNWLPTLERSIKLPPSMMSQSWMGTDFTNDDLVRESSAINDYTHEIKGDSVLLGRDCYKIEMIPKPQAAVVWSKVTVYIDKKDFMQLRTEFFDEDNEMVSVMIASEIKMMGGRLIPAMLEMIPLDKKGQKTVIVYKNLIFDQPIADDFFSTQNMKNPR
jgi:outer membrane lipoprotein-sorting protein